MNNRDRIGNAMDRLSNQARFALATLCIAAIATVAAVAGAGWWAHERAVTAGEIALRQSVLLIDRSVDRAMDSLDYMFNEMEHALLNHNAGNAAQGDLLAVQVATADHVVLAEIVDQDGTVVLASHPDRVGRMRTDLSDGVQAALRPAGPAIPLRQLSIRRAQPSVDPDDPLTGVSNLIAVNMSTAGLTGTIYVEPDFFVEAINSATTWKNQSAELIQPDGAPLTGRTASWMSALHPLTLEVHTGTSADFSRPSNTVRSDNWLIAHRLLPHLGIHIATGVPKGTILQDWHTDLVVAVLIGLAVLLGLCGLGVITVRIDRKNRQTEAALQEMTERLNLAFAGSNDGVWDWNTVSDKAYYSPRWCGLLGYESREIEERPQSWMDLLHPEDRMDVCTAINEHLEGKTPVYSAVHRMLRKDGDWLWVESRGKALRSEDGRAYRMVGTMTDIEEKKRQELALLAARDEAEAANRTKSEFLAVMSHEIRTPMSGVLGMTQVLLNTALTTKQRRFAELIRTSGESLLAILNDILDFSKLEAGHLELEQLDFCLNDEVDAVVRLMEAPARAKDIKLHVDDRTDGRVALRGDPTRIRQILINLIGNAIKFTEHGSVTLRCGAHTTDSGAFKVKFEVIDTGIGMADEVRTSLFQKFSQGDPSIARRYGGTGLGLAICQQLTALMSGTIKVESQLNVGSTFCVSLLLPKAETAPRASTDPLPNVHRPDLANLRVLAAEDNDINQVLLHELLASHVKTLDIVGDGESAVSAARRNAYDVVLMDVRLPGIDGVEATQEIRALGGTWARRPIIALTANAMTDQHEAYIEAGMTACLSKPIDCNKLYAELSRIAANGTHPVLLEKPAMDPTDRPSENPAAPEPTSDHPTLAEEGLAQLVSMIGGDSVAALMAQLAKQLKDSMKQLHESEGEPAALSAIAHTLAGAAGNCQAVRVSRAARALENAVNDGDTIAAPRAALQCAVDETLPAIDAMIARLADEPAAAPTKRALGF